MFSLQKELDEVDIEEDIRSFCGMEYKGKCGE
jgi:hypothetical protein